MYDIEWSKQGRKDCDTAIRAGHKEKIADILATIRRDPYEDTPGHHFERLLGNLKGLCSREINRGNRFLYTVLPNTKKLVDSDGKLYEGIVRVFRAWKHNYKKPKNIKN